MRPWFRSWFNPEPVTIVERVFEDRAMASLNRLDAVPEKLEALEQQVQAFSDKVNKHQHPYIPLDTEGNIIARDVEARKMADDSKGRIQAIYETLKWHGEKIHSVHEDMPGVLSALEDLKGRYEGLFQMIGQLASQPKTLAQRIRALEGKIGLEALFQSRRNQEWSINQHMDTIKGYAGQCEHITEFGTDVGFSTIALLCGRPKKLITYDIIRQDEDVDLIEGVARDYTDTEFIFKLESSLETEIEETELLFIDTLHTYYQLKQELALHCDKVSKFIIMHDTEGHAYTDEMEYPIPPNERGLQPAIREWLEDHPEWVLHEHFTYQYGLSIYRRR